MLLVGAVVGVAVVVAVVAAAVVVLPLPTMAVNRKNNSSQCWIGANHCKSIKNETMENDSQNPDFSTELADYLRCFPAASSCFKLYHVIEYRIDSDCS